MDKEQDDKMVSRLIHLRQSSLAIVKQCFNEDADFRQNVSQAFEFFINKRENKPAEMMGVYLSSALCGASTLKADENSIFSEIPGPEAEKWQPWNGRCCIGSAARRHSFPIPLYPR